MPTEARLVQAHAARRRTRPQARKRALLAGFATQLLLILFVTAIGLRQLGITTNNLNQVVDVDLRKQNLTMSMVVYARERSMILLMLSHIDDPFKRDDLLVQFNRNGGEFAHARQALLEMPLNRRERELIEQQGQLTRLAQPIQLRIIDLIHAEQAREAADLALEQAIPAQDAVMSALWQLSAETKRVAQAARVKARADHAQARFWMYLLSAAALLIGLLVAAVVFYFANRISKERERLASHDALTGLPNRMLFMDRLEQTLIRAKRHQTVVGVMFVDLDRFKRVNDTLGHASGDKLICEVARRLRAAVRAEDLVARLGGDEFVVAVSDVTALNAILQVVEKMLETVTAPYDLSGHEIFCSCSIGVSLYPNDGDTTADLLKHADTAMYHAKRNGRNRFQLYDAAMNAMAEERLLLETDLHYGRERGEFVFHYQPQLDLESGRIHAVEALIRWRHPAKGLLAPAAFLGMLEETGEILGVVRALLVEACRQTVRWQAAGHPELCLAVNVSGKEFWHETLVASVQNALAQSGLPPPSLQLELTESIFMENVDAAVARILALKALGVAVAIDDFGTGYSSLAHLKRFPLDVLKIDRYFVKDIPHSQVNEALVASILALANGLHLGTVAEGVETRAQLDTLRALGCQIVQGYLISRPVPADAIDALLDHDWLHELAPAQPRPLAGQRAEAR